MLWPVELSGNLTRLEAGRGGFRGAWKRLPVPETPNPVVNDSWRGRKGYFDLFFLIVMKFAILNQKKKKKNYLNSDIRSLYPRVPAVVCHGSLRQSFFCWRLKKPIAGYKGFQENRVKQYQWVTKGFKWPWLKFDESSLYCSWQGNLVTFSILR